MSNIICKAIYGCKVPKELLKRVASQQPQVENDRDCGYHEQYDQHEDKHWWGVMLADYEEGINDFWAGFPNETHELKVWVDRLWAELPEEIQVLLGGPKIRLLLALD